MKGQEDDGYLSTCGKATERMISKFRIQPMNYFVKICHEIRLF